MDKVFCVKVGSLSTNCYIIASDKLNAIVIDPGAEADKIMQVINENNLHLKKIILTHGHFDHIGAISALKQKTGAEVYIHQNDEKALSDSKLNLSSFLSLPGVESVKADVILYDGDKITLDNIKLTVLHTPGHTKGSIVLIGDGCLYCGDTLFKGECGRTDLIGGDYGEMLSSLLKISKIEGNYITLSGHGESSNLNYERKNNQYMRRAQDEADI